MHISVLGALDADMETLSLNPSPVPSPTSTSQHIPPLPRPSSSPANRPASSRSHRSHPYFALLPPLVTSTHSRTHKPSGHSDKRLSFVSNTSQSLARSRAHSLVFPAFHSSLPYAVVRDFAYTVDQALHYGAAAETQTESSTPIAEHPTTNSRTRNARGSWSASTGGMEEHESFTHSGARLPATSYVDDDGPPWSEDEDLLSPVVTSVKHKKSMFSLTDAERDRGRGRNRAADGSGRKKSDAALLSPGTGDPTSSAGVFTADIAEDSLDYVSGAGVRTRNVSWQSEGDTYISPRSNPPCDEFASDDEPTPFSDEEESATSRYSRDYQFTIASPDEEMHGKAVALFDFTRENENELPLLEGQVLWVSYRHGQGWLVAQDPKSGESGLVPEEYVRLVRDIEGGLTRLHGGGNELEDYENSPGAASSVDSPMIGSVPSSLHERSGSGTSGKSGKAGRLAQQHYMPVLSHFSTSSKDLEPYPLSASTTSQASPLSVSPPAMTSPTISLPGVPPPTLSPLRMTMEERQSFPENASLIQQQIDEKSVVDVIRGLVDEQEMQEVETETVWLHDA